MSESHLGSTSVAQIAIVVRNIDEAAQRYANVFGLPVPNVIVTAPGRTPNRVIPNRWLNDTGAQRCV